MNFLAISWLAALAALALPITLHLISRGHRRRVLVGSVRLLGLARSRRARRLKPSELLLLALRCLLLVALALALAEPRGWLGAAPSRGWILASPRVLDPDEPRGQEARVQIEQLREAGHQVQVLEADGLEVDGEAAAIDIWSRLREADAALEVGRPLFVFADGGFDRLRGARPTLDRPVQWSTVPLSSKRAPEAVPPPPGEPRVRMYVAAQRQEDAGYLRAALFVAGEHLGITLNFDTRLIEPDMAPDKTGVWPEADLAIWLSPEPVPPALLDRQRWILSDGLERHESCQRRILVRGRELELRRCSSAESVSDEAMLWTDAAGRPLLSASRWPSGEAWPSGERPIATWLRFHGRFHTRWSNLVLTPTFPQWWIEILSQALGLADSTVPDSTVEAIELGAVAPSQVPPAEGASGPSTPHSSAARSLADRSLENWLWLAVALLFALERGIAVVGARTP